MSFFTKKANPLSAVIFAILIGTATNVTAAPVLDIHNDQLIGISGIDLGGSWGKYDVSFDFYSSDTQLYAEDFALQANIALLEMFTLDQYFQGHDFDLFGPTSTRGCNDPRLCAMVSATYKVGNTIYYDGVYNRYDVHADSDSRTQGSSLWLPTKPDYITFATWSPSLPSEVPIPAAAFMFAPALLGFMGLRRKAKKTAA